MRDLLTHRVGLERGDQLWYATTFDRDDILRRIRYLPPSSSVRSQFGYQNIMFLAAGQIVRSVTGKEWDDFVRERIFVPLGMNDTGTSVRSALAIAQCRHPALQVRGPGRADSLSQYRQHRAGRLDQLERRWTWRSGFACSSGMAHMRASSLISPGAAKEMATPQTIIRLEGQMAGSVSGSPFSELRAGLVPERLSRPQARRTRRLASTACARSSENRRHPTDKSHPVP